MFLRNTLAQHDLFRKRMHCIPVILSADDPFVFSSRPVVSCRSHQAERITERLLSLYEKRTVQLKGDETQS